MSFHFDVNAMLEQIASALGVATDTLIQLYPQILKEVVCYDFFGVLWGMFLCITVLCGVCAVGYLYFKSFDMYESPKKSVLLSLIGSTVFCLITTIVTYGLQVFTAPNIVLFSKLFNNQ